MPREAIYGSWWEVLKATVADWRNDKATFLAAALAYYSLFSVAPLLLIATAVAAQIYGEQAARGELFRELQAHLGADGAKFVQGMVVRASEPASGIMATGIGIVTLILGATGFFSQLKDALNTIWAVPAPASAGWKNTVKTRLLSFGMVLCIGLLLIASLVINTALSAADEWLGEVIPGQAMAIQWANALGSLLITIVLFAMLLKYLPDTTISWRHVWVGAAATAVLFALGKHLFGLYLGRGSIRSTYGAAGSVVVVLLWAYYASLIILLGAEFTQAHSRLRPKKGPVREGETSQAERGAA